MRFNVLMKILLIVTVVLIGTISLQAQSVSKIEIINNSSGAKLQVNGQDFMVLGMNWGYMPIGKNYAYDFWGKPDEFIISALAKEMPLLKSMGVNTIRHYVGIPPRWVQYIYETYGIYTVINHTIGRYGLSVDGVWIPNTDYSNEKIRNQLMDEMKTLVDEFKDTPGMLFWLLGNENNYGLHWQSSEIQALPEGERHAAMARYMYSLFGEITDMIKEKDKNRPVAIANGDLLYIDIVAEEIKNLDIFGTNVYRGISARDAFEVVKEKMNIPFMFTEFGADAFNMKTLEEDQIMQAKYLIGQWQEIYEQSYGKGRVGNAIGGFTFQFSDGWWKYKQEENLDVHDINASWPNGGYSEDYEEGENNMNEEWWGICAKGYPDASGLYDLYPRAAFYALQDAYILDPYGDDVTLGKIRTHFSTITAVGAAMKARGDKAALDAKTGGKVRLSGLRMEFETISNGGARVVTPEEPNSGYTSYPRFRGFDHMESYYAKIEAKPAGNVRGSLTLSMLGNVPENTIDEIFYENRGRLLPGLERLKVYEGSVSWEDKWFNLEGFYRSGHYHWGYEGDFFGLYREAFYGPNIDMYNGDAPMGMEITGKKDLTGLKVAFGPELWWGANPAILLKYQRKVGNVTATTVIQEDIDELGKATNSSNIPLPLTRKATFHLEFKKGVFNFELGGIWSGENKVGMPFQFTTGSQGNYTVYDDEIEAVDALGGKFKIMYAKGKISWYLQGASMGLVADGGPTAIQTFTGWRLKDSGKGNQRNILTGFSTRFGNFEFSPNFLWQKPIKDPMPNGVQQPGRLRNVLADPFAVRENREMTAVELVFTFDPTPATWMYHWDSDVREDAGFAATLGFVFKHMPTNMDASLFFAADGRTIYSFASSTPPRDIFEFYYRIVSKPKPGLGLIVNFYAGQGEPNGDDTRLIDRTGVDVRVIYNQIRFESYLKFNDWGPYDYHKDFNLTYPMQLMGDVSFVVGTPEWFEMPQTRVGVRATYRTLDEYTIHRYAPSIAEGFGNGNEWEVRTYLHFNIGM